MKVRTLIGKEIVGRVVKPELGNLDGEGEGTVFSRTEMNGDEKTKERVEMNSG